MLYGLKRGLTTVVLLAMVLGAATVLAQTPQLYFVPAEGSFGCGGTYTLDLMIDGSVTDLHGASLVLEFDNVTVQPLSVSAGPLVTGAACPHYFSWLNATAVGDSIAVDIANLGCAISGPGSILHMTFEGYVQGDTVVRCRRGILRDSANQEIPYVCGEALIDYRCPVADEKAAWGAVKSVYR